MTDIFVPHNSKFTNLEKNELEFQNKLFNENKKSILRELRLLLGIPEILSKLNPETLYRIDVIPDGAKLYKDSAGNFKGVFYKDGKIIQHAKLKAVGPSFVKAASAIGSQILLVSIAIQLNSIEKSVKQLLVGLHDDRIAEIISGVNQFKQAMLVLDDTKRSHIILNAIQTLNTGLEKTIRELKKQIAEAPGTNGSFFDNWGKSKVKVAEEKMTLAEESFYAILLGIKTLSECYATLNEPVAAESVLRKCLLDLKSSNIEMAAEKARLIKVRGDFLPEAPWKNFVNCESKIFSELQLCKHYGPAEIETVSVEFKPTEILEVQK